MRFNKIVALLAATGSAVVATEAVNKVNNVVRHDQPHIVTSIVTVVTTVCNTAASSAATSVAAVSSTSTYAPVVTSAIALSASEEITTTVRLTQLTEVTQVITRPRSSNSSSSSADTTSTPYVTPIGSSCVATPRPSDAVPSYHGESSVAVVVPSSAAVVVPTSVSVVLPVPTSAGIVIPTHANTTYSSPPAATTTPAQFEGAAGKALPSIAVGIIGLLVAAAF